MVTNFIRASVSDLSWRLPGCAERCRVYTVTFPGRRYPEKLVVHDPYHHEAYGHDARLQDGLPTRGIVVQTAELTVDTHGGSVWVDSRSVLLTRVEQALLEYLAGRLGQVCAFSEILLAVWGISGPRNGHLSGSADHQLVRTNVNRLRRKLGNARRLLQSCPGRGYMLADWPATGGGN